MYATEFFAGMSLMAALRKTYTGTDHILTDDKAPVELLGMKMMDELMQ